MTAIARFFFNAHRALLLALFAAMALQTSLAHACIAPIYLTDDLTSNRYGALPDDTLQVVMFYDGAGPANVDLLIQYIDSQNTTCWFTIDNQNTFTTEIGTWEYDLNGAQLTGNFEVVGAVDNGGIDGLAFGLYWRDAGSQYHVTQSNQVGGTTSSDLVGMWPLAMSDATFANRTSQITDPYARDQARMTIDGAALVGNGYHNLPIH